MAEGICYICNQSYTAPSQSALVDQIVGPMMAQHWGHLRGIRWSLKTSLINAQTVEPP